MKFTIAATLRSLIDALTRGPVLPVLVQRGLPTSQIASQLHQQIATAFEGVVEPTVDPWDGTTYWPVWFYDFHVEDGGEMFAIFQAGGRLYRAGVSVEGVNAVLGAVEEVAVQYVPATGRTIITRDAVTGRDRYLRIVSTAVILRGAYPEIDSTALYAAMVRRIEETGQYPVAALLHLGATSRVGQADHVWTDGHCLCETGLFDDTELARQVARGLRDHADEWGTSIVYYGLASRTESIGGVEVTVHTDGIHLFSDWVPEIDAAAHFTGGGIVDRTAREGSIVRERDREALKRLGVDEELIAGIAERAQTVNQRIADDGLIARQAQEDESPQAAAEAAPGEADFEAGDASDDTEPVEAVADADAAASDEADLIVQDGEQEVVISASVVAAIAQQVVASVQEQLGALGEAVQGLVGSVGTLQTGVDALATRVATVERGHEQRATEQVRAMSPRTQIVIGGAPIAQNVGQAAPATKLPAPDRIAATALAKLRPPA